MKVLKNVIISACIALTLAVMPAAHADFAWGELTAGSLEHPGMLDFMPTNSLLYHKIVQSGQNTFVLFIAQDTDSQQYLNLSKWNGTTWERPSDGNTATPYERVTSHIFGANMADISLAVDSAGVPYVSWIEGFYPRQVHISKLVAGVWTAPTSGVAGSDTIATTYSPLPAPFIALDSNDVPYVAWSNGYNDMFEGPAHPDRGHILISKLDSGAWVKPSDDTAGYDNISTTGFAGFTPARTPSIAFDGTRPYVAYVIGQDRLLVNSLQGGVWSGPVTAAVGGDTIANQWSSHAKEAQIVYTDALYIAWFHNPNIVLSRLSGVDYVAPSTGSAGFDVLDTITDGGNALVTLSKAAGNNVYVGWTKAFEIYTTEFDTATSTLVRPSGMGTGADRVSYTTTASTLSQGGILYDGTQPVAFWREAHPTNFQSSALFGSTLVDVGTCGDGMVSFIEQCDDNNTLGGDGCSAMCTYELPGAPTLLQPTSRATTTTLQPSFEMTATDNENDRLQYRIRITSDSACTNIIEESDQSVDATGWTQASYASGETAQYTPAADLPAGLNFWCVSVGDTLAVNPTTGSDQYTEWVQGGAFYAIDGQSPWEEVTPDSDRGGGISLSATQSSFVRGKIAPDGTEYAVWTENRTGMDIDVVIAKRSGNEWVRLEDGVAGASEVSTSAIYSSLPDMIFDDAGNIYVVWNDAWPMELFMRKYDIVQNQWVNPVTNLPGTLALNTALGVTPDSVSKMSMAKDSLGNIYMTLSLQKQGDILPHTLVTYFNVATGVFSRPSDGNTVTPYDFFAHDLATYTTRAQLTLVDDVPYVLWQGTALGTNSIYVSRLLNGVWQAPEAGSGVLADVLSVPGGTITASPSITSDADGNVLVAWRSGSTGGAQIAVVRFDGLDGRWEDFNGNAGNIDLLSGATNSTYSVMIDTFWDGTPVLLWTKYMSLGGSDYTYLVASYEHDGTQWVPIAGASDTVYAGNIDDGVSDFDLQINKATNTAYVFWGGLKNPGEAFVAKYLNTSLPLPPVIPGAVCGNNIREAGEVCDGTDLAGATCTTEGFDAGTLSCATDCQGYTTTMCTHTPPVTPPTPAPGGGGGGGGFSEPPKTQENGNANNTPDVPERPSAPQVPIIGENPGDVPGENGNTNENTGSSGSSQNANGNSSSDLSGDANTNTNSIQPVREEVPYSNEEFRSLILAKSGGEWSEDEWKRMVQSSFRHAGDRVNFTSGCLQDDTVTARLNRTGGAFSDIDAHWARRDILLLAKAAIVDGYSEDASFRPDGSVSRAEFLKVLLTTFCYEQPRNIVLGDVFFDVPVDAWYAPFVAVAKQIGLVTGYLPKIDDDEIVERHGRYFRKDATTHLTPVSAEEEEFVRRVAAFRGRESISRAEATTIFVKALQSDLPENPVTAFKDVVPSQWFMPYVAAAEMKGIVTGNEGYFDPYAPLTRAQMTRMVTNYLLH